LLQVWELRSAILTAGVPNLVCTLLDTIGTSAPLEIYRTTVAALPVFSTPCNDGQIVAADTAFQKARQEIGACRSSVSQTRTPFEIVLFPDDWEAGLNTIPKLLLNHAKLRHFQRFDPLDFWPWTAHPLVSVWPLAKFTTIPNDLTRGDLIMRSILLYLIGIPIPIILVLALFTHHF
jgi:hypothetical protein